MSFIESLGSAMFTMFVVFMVLTCLYFLIKIFSFFIRLFESTVKKSPE